MAAPSSFMLTRQNWAHVLADVFANTYLECGYVLHEEVSVIPPGDDTTLFTTAGIQPWRNWVLDAMRSNSRDEVGRVSAQWCVRTNSLRMIGKSNYITSFRMLSAVAQGRTRIEVLSRMLEFVVDGCGLSFDRLAFVVSGEYRNLPADWASRSALIDELSVARSRIAERPRKWAAPFKPDGPTGPELLVLFDLTGTACGDQCGPLCTCGRYVHFWNLEFLDYRQLPNNEIGRAWTSFAESAGSMEWLASIMSGGGDVFKAAPFRELYDWISDGLKACRGRDQHHPQWEEKLRTLCDHARTISLLLGYGVCPSSKRHGYVLRRLLRRCLAGLDTLGCSPEVLDGMIRRAGDCNVGIPGFPRLTEDHRAMVQSERERFLRAILSARKWFEKHVVAPQRQMNNACVPADTISHLTSSLGVPDEILAGWLREAKLASD